jgi:hypothetical protein
MCSSSNLTKAKLFKRNSSGAFQWGKTLEGSANNYDENGLGVALDSSENIYFVGKTEASPRNGTDDSGFISKFNPSGTLLWVKNVYLSNTTFCTKCAVDLNDNVIVVGKNNTDGAFILSLASDGAVNWKRKISGNSITYISDVHVDAYGDIVLTTDGQVTGSYNGVHTIRLPADGSLIGAYGSYVYEAYTVTVAASTLTASNNSNEISGITSKTAPSLSVADASITHALQLI